MLCAAMLLLLTQETPLQEEGDWTIEAGGSIDLHYVHRDSPIEETRSRLNGAAASADSDDFFAGPIRIALDLKAPEVWSAGLVLGNRVIEAGSNVSLGNHDTRLFVRELWVEAKPSGLDVLQMRGGAQELRLSNRYGDEPFVIDLGGAESAWAGTGASGTSATSERNTLQPTGVRTWLHPNPVVLLQAFAFTLREGGPRSDDEKVYGLYASSRPDDALTVKLLGANFRGTGDEASLWTFGPGIAFAPGPHWLFAGEAYAQRGPDKSAWAADTSVRYSEPDCSVEAGYQTASGKNPDRDTDGGWQSYENVNRFPIVQSAEFGLDWDTNYRLLRAAASWRLCEETELRFDAGHFTLPQRVPLLNSNEDNLGTELVISLLHDLSPSTKGSARFATLLDSDVMETASTDRSDTAWLGVVGLDLTF